MLVLASQPTKGNRGRDSGRPQRPAPEARSQAVQPGLPTAAAAAHRQTAARKRKSSADG